RGRRVIPFEHFINNDLEYLQGVNRESALNVYSKRRIIAVTELKIVEWHNYKHLDWISLSNLTVEERFAFNVSLRMFTRSIVIQRRVEDLQLGVKSYQKWLNLTKPDTYRPDLKRYDDKIYKFKEGDFKRLRLQYIKDMLPLLEHCHPEASGRSLTGSGKLLEEAQPYEARHVSNRSKVP
nr:hypothetical protein [Tanacetum cinerariifolium]